MTIEKWNEKAAGMLDKLCNENNIKYYNRNDGVIFCDNFGAWLMFSPGSVILSANASKNSAARLNTEWEKMLSADGIISLEQASGKLGGMRGKVRQITNINGITAYCKEKYLRMFPKNSLFYVTAENKPITVGIWENHKLYIIGLVMPVLPRGNKFTSDK